MSVALLCYVFFYFVFIYFHTVALTRYIVTSRYLEYRHTTHSHTKPKKYYVLYRFLKRFLLFNDIKIFVMLTFVTYIPGYNYVLWTTLF